MKSVLARLSPQRYTRQRQFSNTTQNGLNILSMRMIKLSITDPNTIQRNKANISPIKFESLPVLPPRTIQSNELVNEWLDSITDEQQTFLVNIKDVPELCKRLAMNRERADAQIPERTRQVLDSSALAVNTSNSDLVSLVSGFDQAAPVPLDEVFASDFRLQLNARSATALVRPDRLPVLTTDEQQLFECVISGSVADLAEFLRQHPEVDVDVQHSSHGGSPLHVAALYNHTGMIQTLIEHGADVNARALNGSTALHWAAGNGHVEACEALLSHKADPLILTSTWFSNSIGKSSGQSAAHWASESNHIDIVNLLNHYSPASLVAVDERGRTAKDLALSEGHVQTAKLLANISREKYVAINVHLLARSNLAVNTNSTRSHRREYPKIQR